MSREVEAAPPAVELKGLRKVYRHRGRQSEAVAGVDLTVPAGSITGLLGPNGAGKTTTLKMLLGLVHPSAGEARIFGQRIGGDGEGIRQRVGYVPETPVLYPSMSGKALAAFCRPLYPRWDGEAFRRCAAALKLPLDMPAGKLSRGQRAALALALALAPRPDLLVLDEPTAGFDPYARREFLSLILDVVASTGCTVLLSSHDVDEVQRVADQVAIMAGGRIRLVKPADELRASEKRVRVAFQAQPPPQVLEDPVIRRLEHEGNRYVFTVSGDTAAFLEKVAAVPHFMLEMVDLSLEEIFFEYTRPAAPAPGGDHHA